MVTLPQMGDSKRIGQKAERALTARMPDNWADVDQSGDYDFGVDLVVTVESEIGMAFTFFLQLKGIENPSVQETIDRQIKISTLNLYRKQAPEVMIAVVDLSNYQTSREDCPIYFKWLDEDFFDLLESKPDTQKKMVVKVDVSNVLDKNFDVLPFLKERSSTITGAKKLVRNLERSGVDPKRAIDDLSRLLPSKPQIIETISLNIDTEFPWIVTPENQQSEILKKSNDFINSGLFLQAKEKLEVILPDRCNLSKLEEAELLSQLATICAANGDLQEAISLREEASHLTGLDKYSLEYFDSLFSVEISPAPEVLKKILIEISGDTTRERMIKAKCLATLERKTEAINLFSDEDDSEVLRKLWVSRMVSDDVLFDQLVEKIAPERLATDDDKFLYFMIFALKLYHDVINSHENIGSDAPIFGRIEYDTELLKKCLNLLEEGWKIAKGLGYPSNVLNIIEESFHIYSILGSTESLKWHLISMLDQRIDCPVVLGALIRMESNASNPMKSLAYIDRLGNNILPEYVSIAIYDSYRIGNFQEALKKTLEQIELLLNCPDEIASKTLGVSLICALTLMEQSSELIIREKLEAYDNKDVVIAISEYFYRLESDPKIKDELDCELWKFYESSGFPVAVAEQLLRTFSPQKDPEKIINLANRVIELRELASSEYKLYCDALIQKEDWTMVTGIAEKFLERNVDVEIWSVIRAIGLENQGDISAALESLELHLDQGIKSENISNNAAYLNFMLGRTEKAEELLLGIYASGGAITKRINALKSLIFIYSNKADSKDKLNSAIINFGRLVDCNNEIDEGQFLMFCFTLYTNNDDEIRADIRSRLQNYTLSFPNSKILRMAYLPVEGSSTDLIANLEEVAGITVQQKEFWERNKLQISRGLLPIPFAILHRFLPDSGDVFSSWNISKFHSKTLPEYYLKQAKYNQDITFAKGVSWIEEIFLDEVSLVILEELDLLEQVLTLSCHVHIFKNVFEELQRRSHPFFGGSQGGTASRIYNVLNSHADSLRLIKSDSDNFFKDYPKKSEYENLIWICDDLNLASFVDFELGDDSLIKVNSFNVLQSLVNSGCLSVEASIAKAELLLSFGISPAEINPIMVASMILKYAKLNRDEFIHGVFRQSLEAILNNKSVDYYSAFRLLSEVFSYIHRSTNIELQGAQLKEFLDFFALRYPVVGISDIYALWFVSSCFLLQPEFEYEVLKQSQKHKRLWDLYSEVYCLHYGESSNKALLLPIIDCIFKDSSNDRVLLHDRVTASFVSGLPESELFQDLYQQRSFIEKSKSTKD